jgi:4-amino-4-deoxy-L-arabinose transferase-like glycosyltransferase
MPESRALKYWGAVPAALVVALFAIRACTATPPLARLALADADAHDPKDTVVRGGSIDVVRGGPVIVGFLSPNNARLVIGTREIVGTGYIKERIVIPAGPTAIHFAAPPSARLIWSPVGRRGDPEYVPASSLSPEPPASATFDHPGTAIGDGIIALALLLVAIGTLLMLARRRLAQVPRGAWLAMGAVFAAALLVRLWDLSGHGQTWDEDTNWAAGRNYITNILGLDASPTSWSWNYEHPPVMKYLVGIGAQFADGFGPARALSALWVAIGCALLVPIGTRLYSRRVGWLAGGIAALLPPLVAHGQIVGHEAPTVLWWSLGILLALCVHDGEPDARTLRIRLAWVGVAIGVATASRFTNGLLGPVCLAIICCDAPRARRVRTTLEAGIGMPIIAFATLYALWPRLWTGPFTALSESLQKLKAPHSAEPFLGAMTNHPGPHYFLVYLAATLPLGVLLGVLAWGLRARRDRATLVLAAWFVIPLAVTFSPVVQDGVRYVMPCIMALAVAAAAGWEHVATRIERHWAPAFRALAAALGVYLAITAFRIHPYYLDYFGEQVGEAGTVAAHGWFETAWWGEGVDRAVDYVNEHADPGARVFRDCIEPAHLAWFRAGLWVPMAHAKDQADWIVTYAPQTHRCAIPQGFQRVFGVDAEGAVLAEVWKR